MFDLNEELILDGFNFPWLIWVQLAVTILLLFVLFCGFSIITEDLSTTTSCSSSTSSFPSSRSGAKKSFFNGSAYFQVEEDINLKQSDTAGNARKVNVGEQSLETELPAKDVAHVRPFGGRADHPCSYFGFAKQAILKCLGLDALFESLLKKKDMNNDEELASRSDSSM